MTMALGILPTTYLRLYDTLRLTYITWNVRMSRVAIRIPAYRPMFIFTGKTLPIMMQPESFSVKTLIVSSLLSL
jgi:hypothetical protein